MTEYRKKLIEVALPLDAINAASAREKSIRHGHPSTLHLWWARRPLAACRAVLFGQLVDDPSSWPDRFPTEQAQDKERQRLFRIIEELVKWENSTNETVLDAARREIALSLARGRVADGEGTERDQEVLVDGASMKVIRKYLAEVAPPVHDPFAGGGSIPLEAQRLGLRAIASDLNPVAVMINKALIEIPPKFEGRPPVGPVPKGSKQTTMKKKWHGAQGLAEDVRRYGEWMREEAFKRIGHLYPDVEVTAEMAKDRPDLKPLIGQKLTVIAWLWARTVESPNPVFKGVHVPLARSFILSTKKGKHAWVEAVFASDRKSYKFLVRSGGKGKPEVEGTVNRNGGTCLASGDPIPFTYIREEAKSGRMGARMMAIVAQGGKSRIYLPPTSEMQALAESASPVDVPDTDLPEKALGFRVQEYGMKKHQDLFSRRQLVALTTFSDLIPLVQKNVTAGAIEAGFGSEGPPLERGGIEAAAYGDAVALILSLSVGKLADYNSSLVQWSQGRDQAVHVFGRHTLSMVWDYAEVNTFAGAAGDIRVSISGQARVLESLVSFVNPVVEQRSAQEPFDTASIFSTDPPYFDNIGYGDLSDYFYVWLRRSLAGQKLRILSTLLVPKASELIASPHRHGGKEGAERFFLEGMSNVLVNMARSLSGDFPVTIYYAFKQSTATNAGVSSSGWEAFLQAVIDANLAISGTWPIRSEKPGRLRETGSNALASSIVLVCRRKSADAPIVSRGDVVRALKQELPLAIKAIQKCNIAPVDLAQASIGPGMAIFSRHGKVLEHDGSIMSVRTALQLINEVMDELRGEEETDLDRESRFAITWFANHAFEEGPFGEAETLAKARNVAVSGVENSGVLKSAAGKVRLLKRDEMPEDWSPLTDKTLTVWECTQHLIKRLEKDGEQAAAELLAKMGPRGEQARILAYRLFTICERKKWAEEARAYNGLVIAWPELERLADGENAGAPGTQAGLFEEA